MSWQEGFVEEFSQQLINRGYDVPCGIIAAAARKALPLIEVTPGMLVSGASVRVPPFASRAEAVGTIFDAMKTHCAKEKTP
jgi:hypothetical protein